MKNLKIYCGCLNDYNLSQIKKLNYIPVGLKNNNFSGEWLRDNTLINISNKNSYYGEYTFYYWYWKNLLKNKKKMIGLVFVLTENFGVIKVKKKVKM